jgi:endonuclease YncB( thermonuclease family)
LAKQATAGAAGAISARRTKRHPLSAARFGLFLLIACSSLAPDASGDAPVIGIARVLDADTIEIYGLHIQLAKIDAPEIQQLCQQDRWQWRCGEAASEALAQFLWRRLVICRGDDVDRLGRMVAVCHVGSRNINSWLVAEGWAIKEQGSSTYQAEEESARNARRGIWSSRFVAPWNRASQVPNAGCEC